MLYGTIIGDICGSVYEGLEPIYNPELFAVDSMFTDDTVCTLAIANAILKNLPYEDSLYDICNKHLYRKYGPSFVDWLRSENQLPYNSFGNGSAMRVAPVAWAFNNLDIVLKEAELSASGTHNHPEGIKGAKAIAHAIFLARNNADKNHILDIMESEYGYPLLDGETIKNENDFTMTCQKSIPIVMAAFNESNSFEDCIRTAISYGWDTDTNAAIAGSIAEAYYGEPNNSWINKCKSYLTPDLLDILEDFNNRFN